MMSTQRPYYLLILILFIAVTISFTSAYADDAKPKFNVIEPKITLTPLPGSITVQTAITPTPPATGDTPILMPPTSPVLDDFNRANGSIGSNWSGDTGGYSIVSNRLNVTGNTQSAIFWDPTMFGADQEAYVTLGTIAGTGEIGLILKAQSNTGLPPLIEVFYSPGGNVQVWSYNGSAWQPHGAEIQVSFATGDRLGAIANAYGQVDVYKNDTRIGVRFVTNWSDFADPGYIGLFNLNTSGTILDNFGGGTVGPFPSPTPTGIPCYDPLTCDPVTAYNSRWYCDIAVPACTDPTPWIGTSISWPSSLAYSTNNRSGNQGRRVFSAIGNNELFPYMMQDLAEGCQVTVIAGKVVIIEWQRGTDVWEEIHLEVGQSYTIDLNPPQDNAMIEGPNELQDEFVVALTNCASPTKVQLLDLKVTSRARTALFTQMTIIIGIPVTFMIWLFKRKRQQIDQ